MDEDIFHISSKSVASTENLVGITSRGRWLTRMTRSEKRLLIGISVLLILFLIFFICFLVTQKQYQDLLGTKVCTSSECIESSIMLLQSIDRTHDPCDNFYAYACGRFHEEHPISPIYQHNSWFLEKELKLDRLVQLILESRRRIGDLKSIKEAKELYASCNNRTRLDMMGLQPLFDLLKIVKLPSSVPTKENSEGQFDLSETLALVQRHLSKDILVTLSVSKASSNTTELPRNGTVIMVISEIFEDLEESHSWVNPYNSSTVITLAFKIIVFQAELFQDSDLREDDDTAKEEQTTFEELQTMLDGETSNRDSANRINWKVYFKTLMEGIGEFDVNTEVVIVQNLNYFKFLAKFLGKSRPESIQRYIWWEVVEDYGKYTTKEMVDIYNKYYEKVMDDTAGLLPRSATCTRLLRKLLDVALSHEMAKLNDFSRDIGKVGEMLKDIREVFKSMVRESSWMDYDTKVVTLDKATSVTQFIGYPTWIADREKIDIFYTNLTLERSEFLLNIMRVQRWSVEKVLVGFASYGEQQDLSFGLLNPLQVNAFYSRSDNAIVIPAGILQSPFYFRGLESLNYGAIGTVLGHEFTHGFDIEGKDYNKFGEHQENFWPKDVTKEYTDRAQCFIDQYSNFKLTPNKRLNGSFTLAENIADNGGLRESYRAYQMFAARHGKEHLLPGFENFTPEQLLFLSYANIWCEASTPSYKRLAFRDSHSPNSVRVLATLQNLKEFSDAYSCRSGSYMNPTIKCIVW